SNEARENKHVPRLKLSLKLSKLKTAPLGGSDHHQQQRYLDGENAPLGNGPDTASSAIDTQSSANISKMPRIKLRLSLGKTGCKRLLSPSDETASTLTEADVTLGVPRARAGVKRPRALASQAPMPSLLSTPQLSTPVTVSKGYEEDDDDEDNPVTIDIDGDTNNELSDTNSMLGYEGGDDANSVHSGAESIYSRASTPQPGQRGQKMPPKKRRRRAQDSSAADSGKGRPRAKWSKTSLPRKPGHNGSVGESPAISSFRGNPANSTRTLQSTLERLIRKFIKKDAYAMFLEPVDTSVVTDYLDVIKHPMDFGTMKKRVESRHYTSIDQFKSDFLLVCRNCQLYNAPTTRYYKCASRIEEYGRTIIAKESAKLKAVLEARREAAAKNLDDASDANSVDSVTAPSSYRGGDTALSASEWSAVAAPVIAGRPSLSRQQSLDASSRSGSGGGQARRKKVMDTKPFFRGYLPDGSADIANLTPFEVECWSAPAVPFLSRSMQPLVQATPWSKASFLDFGAFDRKYPDAPRLADDDPLLQLLAGGDEGLAYWKSICDFTQDADEKTRGYVARVARHLSDGVCPVVAETMHRIAAESWRPADPAGEHDSLVGWLDSFMPSGCRGKAEVPHVFGREFVESKDEIFDWMHWIMADPQSPWDLLDANSDLLRRHLSAEATEAAKPEAEHADALAKLRRNLFALVHKYTSYGLSDDGTGLHHTPAAVSS
ncbi:hypothetical protein EV182_002188, partial [Spiromyces aspiralis]